SDLLDYVGLAGNAKSVTVKARDGYAKSFDLNDKKNGVYWKDKDGNPVILAWVVDGKNAEGGLQLIIGQENDEDINRPNWVKDIVSITVNAKSASSSENSDPTWNGDKEDPDAPVTEVITQTVDAKTIVIGTAAVSSVNAKELQEAVSAAEKQTGEGKEAVVEINAVSGNKNVDEVSVTIPKAGLESAAAAENTDLAVKTDLADLVLTSELAAELKDFGDLKITVKKTGEGTLDVAFTGGNKAVEDLENAIKISAADTGLAKDNAVVYLVSEDGTKKVLPFSAIVDGKVVFETRAMGTFSVEYKERVFADTENHWSKDNVSFLAVRGVINGKSADRFDPDGKVTRAEFVKMLAGLAEDVDFSQVKPMGFSDVKTGDWYAQFANWAASEGIVTGYTDGTFRGNDYITREQMAAMIERFVAAVGDNLKIVNEKKTFTDSSAISPWAVNSVNKVCQYGLLNGNANGTVAPQADTTRAQAATVLVNYIKAVLK
ncbi:MAG: S-layer homology domain-containing protein, partial [Anaerovoracaceae bacterium]|nr:S-layer homology domain-containing protein [Anaerovoracaceae bacterium]